MNKLFAALLCLCSSTAFANSACDKPKNDFDGLYCLNKVYQQADNELNEVYKKLNDKLDNDGKKALKKGQLAWMTERNSSCSMNKDDGFYVNLDCAADTTIKRAQFLQDRLREASARVAGTASCSTILNAVPPLRAALAVLF